MDKLFITPAQAEALAAIPKKQHAYGVWIEGLLHDDPMDVDALLVSVGSDYYRVSAAGVISQVKFEASKAK
jgi:hypothetical protein